MHRFQTLRHLRTFACSVALLATACALPAAHAQSDQVLAKARERGTLRVANTQSSPPWSQIDEKNQPAGYDVDVAMEIGRRIGLPKVVFIADTYKNFISSLNADKYDVVINILTPTEERKKQADFSDIYILSTLQIFVRDDNKTINSRADLSGKRLGVSGGTLNESWVREHIKDADIRVYNTSLMAFSDLVNGRIDAAIYSLANGTVLARANKLPVKLVGEVLTEEPAAVAFKKEQPALQAAINKAIADMIEDGTLTRISQNWLNGFDMGRALKAHSGTH